MVLAEDPCGLNTKGAVRNFALTVKDAKQATVYCHNIEACGACVCGLGWQSKAIHVVSQTQGCPPRRCPHTVHAGIASRTLFISANPLKLPESPVVATRLFVQAGAGDCRHFRSLPDAARRQRTPGPVAMDEFCKSRKLGAPMGQEGAPQGVELPVVVAEYSAAIDMSRTGAVWSETTRDVATEIVVPLSVLEALGPDVFAGQLVSVTCATSPRVKHVARLVPADLCRDPLLSPAAAEANGLDAAACTVAGKPAALLSPVLAFNLGIPYQIAQLMSLMQPDADKRRPPRRSTVTLTPLPSAWPDDSDDAAKTTPWTPGNSAPTMHAATHVGLAICATADVLPPFQIEDYQEELQEAAKALQGKPREEEDADKNALDPLTEQERENRDKEMMSVRASHPCFSLLARSSRAAHDRSLTRSRTPSCTNPQAHSLASWRVRASQCKLTPPAARCRRSQTSQRRSTLCASATSLSSRRSARRSWARCRRRTRRAPLQSASSCS